MGFNIKVIKLTDVKDPDEAFSKDPALFPASVENAVDYFEFLIQTNFAEESDKKKNDPLFLKKFVTDYLDVVKLIPEEFLKDFYIRKLSKVTGFSLANLQLEMDKKKSIKISESVVTKTAAKQKKSFEDLMWTYFFMSKVTHEKILSETKFLSESLEQKELYNNYVLNYNAIDFDNIEVPERYQILSLELEASGLDLNRFDFNIEITQILNRMKQKFRQSRLNEIKRKLNNCSAQEQLQLLSQYKHLMSL